MRDEAQGNDPRRDLPGEDPRPVVALPRPGLPTGLLVVVSLAAAVVLFVLLDARRRSASLAMRQPDTALIASPPPLVVPPEPTATPVVLLDVAPPAPVRLPVAPLQPRPVPQTVVVPTVAAPIIAPVLSPAPRPTPPLAEPALVVDGGAEVRGTAATTPSNVGAAARPATVGGTGDDAGARATVIRSRTDVMAVGTLIPAVLETPIDTARPGLVRAIVSRDTPGFDGRRVLVPRGSRLIGEYQSDVRGGQNRVLVTWTRLLRPDGVTIQLGSPASDPLGGAGIPGQVHSFFLQRFAGAVLQSALTVGVNVASRPGNGSIIVGVPTGPVNTIGQQLQPADDYRPKITVKQGATLNVFVARDLDFSGVGQVR